jgi:hypothetical protein
MDEKTFLLVTRASCGEHTATDVEYWCLYITPVQARQWLEAIGRVKELQKDDAFLQLASRVYGVEVFYLSNWMAVAESEQDNLEEQIEADGGIIMSDANMAAFGLNAPEERLDCETAVITDDSVIFRARFKYGGGGIESDSIPASLFEKIANSDEVNEGQ